MEYLIGITWFALAITTARIARRKRRQYGSWLIYGLLAPGISLVDVMTKRRWRFIPAAAERQILP